MPTTPAATIRGWIMSPPRPAALRLTCGTEQTIIKPIPGTQSFAQIARSVEAMAPSLLQALDESGGVIRACRPFELVDQADDDAAAAAPKIVTNDPESARFHLFATLLADAYKHANEVAFGKMVELFSIVAKRGESLEKSLASTERLLRQAWREVDEAELEKAENPLNKMAEAFLAQAQPNGQNGAGK